MQSRATRTTMAGWPSFWWWSTATSARWTLFTEQPNQKNISGSFILSTFKPEPIMVEQKTIIDPSSSPSITLFFCDRCLRFSPQYRSDVGRIEQRPFPKTTLICLFDQQCQHSWDRSSKTLLYLGSLFWGQNPPNIDLSASVQKRKKSFCCDLKLRSNWHRRKEMIAAQKKTVS